MKPTSLDKSQTTGSASCAEVGVFAVAERGYLPKVELRRRRNLEDLWDRSPVRCMVLLESMVRGCRSRKRLEKMLGRDVSRVMNLLPPDSTCGTWDSTWAAKNAGLLQRHFMDTFRGPTMPKIVLLGRRVSIAWGCGDLEWGSTWKMGEIPHILLPHPSGRSRVLNSPEWKDRIQDRIKEFFE